MRSPNTSPFTYRNKNTQILMGQVTEILKAVSQGLPNAREQLTQVVYDDLRSMAALRLQLESRGHTLQPTALVNEAWMRLMSGDAEFANRKHFFGAAAEAMRRCLIDYARKRGARKRWSSQTSKAEDVSSLLENVSLNDQLLDLDTALAAFAAIDPDKAEIVKLKFFAGLSMEEIAFLHDLSLSTVERHWRYSKVWLYDFMNRERT